MNTYHVSVLLQETIELLDIQSGQKYIDATLGGGGHAKAILKHGGKVLGLDLDQDAVDYVTQISGYKIGRDLILVKGNFNNLEEIAKKNNFEKVTGIIFDLGVSSHQFDIADRGFSFQKDGPLDMRMDRNFKIQAKDLVNILTKGELYELFNKLGEERFSHPIANGIIRARRIKQLQTTKELAEIISRAVPGNGGQEVKARIFQALRIAINDELNNLRSALPQALSLLNGGGKIAVISFHSLEDRIVKKQFLKWIDEEQGILLTKKPIRPGREEIEKNKRARSAKLRIFKKK